MTSPKKLNIHRGPFSLSFLLLLQKDEHKNCYLILTSEYPVISHIYIYSNMAIYNSLCYKYTYTIFSGWMKLYFKFRYKFLRSEKLISLFLLDRPKLSLLLHAIIFPLYPCYQMAAALNMLHCGINKLHHICHGVLHICTHRAIMLCANHGSGQSMDGTTPDGTTLLAQSMDCASSHSTSGLLTFRLAFSLSPGRNVPFRAWWISSIHIMGVT